MTTFKDDPRGLAGMHPDFLGASDYRVGQHVVWHHFDGNDYEGIITHVYSPGGDVESRWSVHVDVGKIGHLKNVTQSGRDDPTGEGTFSLKPTDDSVGDKLTGNAKAGTKLPTRSDVNPRPPADAGDTPLTLEDFDISPAPVDTPQEDFKADPEAEIRDDQVHNENDAELTQEDDEGWDTPANQETDAVGNPEVHGAGTTEVDDEAHLLPPPKTPKGA